MKSIFFCLCACLILWGCAGNEPEAETKIPKPIPKVAKPDPKLIRLFILPFENGMRGKATDYLSTGLAAFLTERFEEAVQDPKLTETLAAQGFRLETFSGPLIMTQEQAALRTDSHARIDLKAARAAADLQGATQVLTGFYSGDVSKFKLAIGLYDLDAKDGLVIRAEASIGPISIYVKKAARPGVQIVDVQSMTATLAAQVLAKSGFVLPPEAVERLKRPETPDAMSFINYARALDRHFRPVPVDKHRSDLELAAKAVSIWPDFYSARRLYGYLLWQSGSIDKARTHFREILEPLQPADASKPRRIGLPNDVRTLTMLGRVELESKQYQTAIGYLERAAAHAPGDSQVHFWLGEAHARLGDTAKAVAGYELSRSLDPNNVETHRALSALYAVSRRYDDAAADLEVVVSREPKNIQALYLLAACRRAGGHREQALEEYDRGLERFPKDARLHKFRGDILTSLGKLPEAQGAYDHAKKLAPRDARFSGKATLAGDALIAEITAADTLHDGMEKSRAEAQLATSIATWDLAWHGKEACQDGRSGSDFLLAQANARLFDHDGTVLTGSAISIGRALKNGEGFALTPDEQGSAEMLLRFAKTSAIDLRELFTSYGHARDLLDRYGCGLTVRMATIEEVRERNRHLVVEQPEPPARDSSGISPVVPTDVIGNVTFKIKNETDRETVIIFLPDGKPLEPAAPAHGVWSYTTKLGYHTFCVLPKTGASDCGKPGTVRYDYFHEGWSISVR